MLKHTVALALLLVSLNVFAEEPWSRFHGPDGTGVSETPAPVRWSESDYRWKVELPGEGHSSPVLWGGRVYVTCTDPQTAEQWLVAVSASSGATVWKFALESQPYPHHAFNSFASATPAADSRCVYVPVSSADHHQLVAVTHEGKEAWRYEIGVFKSQHGTGASPIVYKDTVILPNDQDGVSSIVAIGTADGKVRWKADRKSGMAAYATPCVYTGRDGKDQLIAPSTASGLAGLDPATGKQLWALGDLFAKRVVASPVVAGDLVIASCGEGGGGKRLVAVRPGSFDGSKNAQIVYEVDKALPYVPTPVYRNGLLFLLNDGGIGTCLDAATGAVKWRERVIGESFASPVVVGGVVYCVSRTGEVVTFKWGDKHEPLGDATLGEPSHATPAVSQGVIYFRTLRHLICVGGPARA